MTRTRTPKPKPATTVASQFVHAHLGKSAFAPLTGTDWRAWHAFVYLLELYRVSRDPRSVLAMKATLHCAQASVMDIFIQTIPAMLDWSDVRTLWPLIAHPHADTDLAALDVSSNGHITSYRGFPQCDHRDEHDMATDTPKGKRCTKSATHRIEWADHRRYSYGCDAHLAIDPSATVKPLRIVPLNPAK